MTHSEAHGKVICVFLELHTDGVSTCLSWAPGGLWRSERPLIDRLLKSTAVSIPSTAFGRPTSALVDSRLIMHRILQ